MRRRWSDRAAVNGGDRNYRRCGRRARRRRYSCRRRRCRLHGRRRMCRQIGYRQKRQFNETKIKQNSFNYDITDKDTQSISLVYTCSDWVWNCRR